MVEIQPAAVAESGRRGRCCAGRSASCLAPRRGADRRRCRWQPGVPSLLAGGCCCERRPGHGPALQAGRPDRKAGSPCGARRSPMQSFRQCWRLAWPLILSNLSVPLLGMVDTAVVGHLPQAASPGGRRPGCHGAERPLFPLRLPAHGHHRPHGPGAGCRRPGGSAARRWSAGSWWPSRWGCFSWSRGRSRSRQRARCWRRRLPPSRASPPTSRSGSAGRRRHSAPSSLLGWFLGLQDARRPLALMVLTNVLNGGLAVFMVFGLGMAACRRGAGDGRRRVGWPRARARPEPPRTGGVWVACRQRQAVMRRHQVPPASPGEPRPLPAQPAAGGRVPCHGGPGLAAGRGDAGRQCRADDPVHGLGLWPRRFRPRDRGAGGPGRGRALGPGAARGREGGVCQRRPARGGDEPRLRAAAVRC